MKIIANGSVLFVAVLHFLFLVLEIFLWDTPTGHTVFSMTPEFADQSKALAMNQGLYNGFLALGLVWAAVANRFDLKLFFLLCVVCAGVFGAVTVGMTILYVQALPAVFALAMVYLEHK